MKNCCRQYSNSITTKTVNSCAAGCQGPLLCPDQVERVLAGIKIHCRRRDVVERRLRFGAVGGMPPSANLAVLGRIRLETTAAAIPEAARLEPRCLATSIGVAAQSGPARCSERELRRTGSGAIATASAACEHARCVCCGSARRSLTAARLRLARQSGGAPSTRLRHPSCF